MKICDQKTYDELKIIRDFMQDAPTLDYNEDRVLSWISIMSWEIGKAMVEYELSGV